MTIITHQRLNHLECWRKCNFLRQGVVSAVALTQWLHSSGLDNGGREVWWAAPAELSQTLAGSTRDGRSGWYNRRQQPSDESPPSLPATVNWLRNWPGSTCSSLTETCHSHQSVCVLCVHGTAKRLLTGTSIASFLWITASDITETNQTAVRHYHNSNRCAITWTVLELDTTWYS